MLIPYILCVDCKHLELGKEKNGRPVCKAYPNGIPKEVIESKSKPNLDKNEPCNNGIKFEHD
jgi:hypothetical protein